LTKGVLQRGDLLFFDTENATPSMVTHVGMYVDDARMINAMSPNLNIGYGNLAGPFWASRFLFGRRVSPIDISGPWGLAFVPPVPLGVCAAAVQQTAPNPSTNTLSMTGSCVPGGVINVSGSFTDLITRRFSVSGTASLCPFLSFSGTASADGLSLGGTFNCGNLVNGVWAGTGGSTCTPPPSGLVGWWPFDGNANDIVGGNNGTSENGATFGSGKVGQAFALDGVDDYINVPDAAALRPASLTIEGWARFDITGVCCRVG
jgi:hypothetical protein